MGCQIASDTFQAPGQIQERIDGRNIRPYRPVFEQACDSAWAVR